MANDREPTQEWLTIGEAARALGVSDEAVRQKAKRRTLRFMKGNDCRLRVLIDTSPTTDLRQTKTVPAKLMLYRNTYRRCVNSLSSSAQTMWRSGIG